MAKDIRDKITEVSQEHSFFHWDLEFPDIFYEEDGKRKVNPGFDAVIGNPPYVRADIDDLRYQNQRKWMVECGQFVSLYEKWDLYVAFIEKTLYLLKPKAMLSFIVSNSINTSKYAIKIKELIHSKYFLKKIDLFKNVEVFKNIGVGSVILTIQNSLSKKLATRILHTNDFNNTVTLESVGDIGQIYRIATINLEKYFVNCELLGNICYLSNGMALSSDEKTAKGEFTKDDLISDTYDKIHNRKYTEADYITAYRIKRMMYLEWGTERCPSKIRRQTFPELYQFPKLIRGFTADAIFDDQQVLCNHGCIIMVSYYRLNGIKNRSIETSIKKSTNLHRNELERISKKFDLKYILGIVNSKLAKCYLNTIRRHRIEYYFYPDDLKKLPIKYPTAKQKIKILSYINDILKIVEYDKGDKKALDHKIQAINDKINDEVFVIYGIEDSLKKKINDEFCKTNKTDKNL